MQRRDQSTSGSAGGYLIPQDFSDKLDVALKAFSNVRGVCDTFRTDTGTTMPYPALDDTSNTGELLAENTTYAGQDATLGVINYTSYKYSSKGLLVSTELLNDSYFTLDQILAGKAPRELLALIPLMKRGGDDGIISQWKGIVGAETDPPRLADSGLAVMFAHAVGRDLWENAVKELKMDVPKIV